MYLLLDIFVIVVVFLAGALAAAVAFGGPRRPPPMASINEPFKSVDFTDLPPLSRYDAEDGAALAYRRYAPSGSGGIRGSVVLIHGSSASSNSLHVLAKAFAVAGYEAYALDVRGHGASGVKGSIDYIGQLEDDLASFVHAVPMSKPATLAGFSSGGGFALRFAGGQRQDEFANYLLLSPFLGPDAPNLHPGNGSWVKVGIARMIGLTVLNRLGVRAFNGLPIMSFALSEEVKAFLTPTYSFSLAANFQPLADYEANIRAVRRPVAVVAGAADEVFMTDKLEGIIRKQGQRWPVTLLPGIGHIPLTLDPGALRASVQAVEAMPKSEA
ncbi:alpha/beta hydrolase [Chromobacterium vaccinii]|uniref:alpha/beta hydrolase n=1 Tax=Chromobacterium vaccinii TaxID=1108595 RepID=UPI000B28E986|nr:alpha/beta hydrolase [Chromobacterium vaccinii]